MNFFKYSARLPLVIAGPGIATGEAENACRLSIYCLHSQILLGEPIDGRSLMPLAKDEGDPVDE